MENIDEVKDPIIALENLRQIEELSKKTLEDAMKPIEEGGATESVIEDLRTRYYLAKQEREDFEKSIKVQPPQS